MISYHYRIRQASTGKYLKASRWGTLAGWTIIWGSIEESHLFELDQIEDGSKRCDCDKDDIDIVEYKTETVAVRTFRPSEGWREAPRKAKQ